MDKAWTIVGKEFLPNEGKAFKTTKELYEINFRSSFYGTPLLKTG